MLLANQLCAAAIFQQHELAAGIRLIAPILADAVSLNGKPAVIAIGIGLTERLEGNQVFPVFCNGFLPAYDPEQLLDPIALFAKEVIVLDVIIIRRPGIRHSRCFLEIFFTPYFPYDFFLFRLRLRSSGYG